MVQILWCKGVEYDTHAEDIANCHNSLTQVHHRLILCTRWSAFFHDLRISNGGPCSDTATSWWEFHVLEYLSPLLNLYPLSSYPWKEICSSGS